MKRRRGKVLLIGIVAIGLGALIWFSLPPREPKYGDLSLTQLTWYLSTDNFPNRPTWEDLFFAEHGIWSIGTNGVPFLISNIKNQPSPWIEKLRYRLDKSPLPKLQNLLPVDCSSEAASAFQVFGPLAKPWLPELESLTTNSRPEIASAALWAINSIRDEDACSIHMRFLDNPNLHIQRMAIAGIGDLGWRGREAVPQLITMTQSTNSESAKLAAMALCGISISPETTIPVLVDRLRGAERWEANILMRGIARFGTSAEKYLPLIQQAFTNQWGAMAATQILSGIRFEMVDGAIIRGPVKEKRIALTFTAHEFGEGGETILDDLDRHKSKASFFLTGDFLANSNFQPVVDRMKSEGHLVGPHSDKHLLYCSWDSARKTLISRHEFRRDFLDNVRRIAPEELRESIYGGPPASRGTSYLLPPFEHYNRDIADWTHELGRTLINFTPGTRSHADYTGEADTNFVSSQAIFDSILKREREDPHGLNGFILLLHLGSGPGRQDKFHTRFGELLDVLAGKGYQFVRVDELLEPPKEETR